MEVRWSTYVVQKLMEKGEILGVIKVESKSVQSNVRCRITYQTHK